MSQTFEIPHLRTLARHALPNLVHGTLIPLAIFLVTLRVLGIWGAILVGLVWSYTGIIVRLVARRRIPGVLVISAVTLTARTAVAFGTGSTFVYFLQPTIGTALVAVAFLVSVPLGCPLAQRLAVDFCPLPPELLANPHVRRIFLRISTLWALVGFVNVTIALWLLLSQPVATFVVARTVVSATLTVSAIIGSTVWFTRSMKRHGVLAAKSKLSSA